MDERRSSDRQRFAHLVHVIHWREGGACSGDVFACGVAHRKHTGDILFPASLHDAVLAAGRSKCRLRPVGRQAGCLDIRIGGGLVVVHDDQEIVVGLKCAGNTADSHITATEVAAERDGVDRFILDLAFALERPKPCSHAYGRGAACAELRMHPGHNPGSGHVAGIGDVHATRRTGDDGPRTRRLDKATHRCRRFAPLTSAMTRRVELFQRDFVNAFDFVVNNHIARHISLLIWNLGAG